MNSTKGQVAARLLLPILVVLAVVPCEPDLAGHVLSETKGVPDAPSLIRSELQAGHFAEAEALARDHRAAVIRAGREGSLEYARALDLLVEAMLDGGKAIEDETDQLSQEAVTLKEYLFPHGHPELGTSLVLIGRVHLDRGDSTTAVAVMRRGLAMLEAGDPEGPELISAYRNLGNALQADGDFSGAESAYKRQGQLIEIHRGELHMDAASHAYNTARLLSELGDWEGARWYFKRAARIIEIVQGPDNPRMAYALIGLGNTNTFLGDPTAALEVLEKALAIARDTMRPTNPFIASVHEGIGFAQLQMNDLAAAERSFNEALELARKEYGPDHEATGRAHRLLAGVALAANDLDAAEFHLSKAAEIFARSKNKNLLLEVWLERARLLAKRGDLDRAVAEMRAVQEDSAIFMPDHPDTLGRRVKLADLMLQAGQPNESKATLRVALEELTRLLGKDDFRYIQALAYLALASALTGEPDEAIGYAVQAENLGTERERLLIAGLSERQAIRFASERVGALDLLITLAAKSGQGESVVLAWNAVTHARGAVLDELARRHKAASISGNLAAAAEFAVASRRLANLLVRGPAGDFKSFRNKVDLARHNREAAERKLARSSRSHRRLQKERSIDFEQVRESLPEGSALVAYVIYDHHRYAETPERSENWSIEQEQQREYAAFVLSGDGSTLVIRLGSAEKLEAAVQVVRDELGNGITSEAPALESAYRRKASTLRKMIWDPLAEAIDDAKRIFIIPAGALHLINFATLPLNGGLYMADSDRVLHYLSTERDLVLLPESDSGQGLLVIGGPDYDTPPNPVAIATKVQQKVQPAATRGGLSSNLGTVPGVGNSAVFRGGRSECPELSGINFESLESSVAEGDSVAQRWESAPTAWGGGDVLVLSGTEASEEAFKKNAAGRRVIHMATHGFFLDGTCPSVVFRGRGIGELSSGGQPGAIYSRADESPLVLAGLVLAGANLRDEDGSREEDGILTAEEIAALDLRGTEWAVLSACDTGLGVIRPGEGVFGLRRAFSVAGVRTLIMTLWPVRDDIAATWMEGLYASRLENGLDAADSVSGATASVLESRRKNGLSTHPAVWGAFVASGDWR